MKRIILIALVLLLTACSPNTGTIDGTGDTPQVGVGDVTPAPDLESDGDAVAMRIGNVEISSNEYRYHYYSTVQTYIGYLGAEMMGIDESKPFEEQYFEEGVTWADFFAEQTIAAVRNTVLLSEQANKAGMTLDESFKSEVTNQIDELKSICETNGMTMEQMLKKYYGGTMDENTIRGIMERTYLGYQFELDKRENVDVSDPVILEYYNHRAGDFDVVDYISYMFETEDEANQCLAAIADKDSFYKYINDSKGENLDDYTAVGESNTGDEFSVWLFDAERTAGDVTVIQAYEMYTVLFFLNRYQPDGVSIRHVLISNENRTAEEARAKAEELYNSWKNGPATEDTFGLLATNNTEDPGSAQNGGLYEDVQPGQMVPEFDSWCFDPARKQGDSGLVDTQFGTHIMYYSGSSWKKQVIQAYIEEVYSEFYESLLDQYQVEQIDMNVAK